MESPKRKSESECLGSEEQRKRFAREKQDEEEEEREEEEDEEASHGCVDWDRGILEKQIDKLRAQNAYLAASKQEQERKLVLARKKLTFICELTGYLE